MDRRVTEFVKVWKSTLKTYHECLGEVYVTLAQGEYGKDCVSWDCVSIWFKYQAAPTRRTTVTIVGTGLPNHCLHQATGSISLTLSSPRLLAVEIDHCCLKTLAEDFLNFLNPNSSVTLSSACLSCLHATYALCMFHFIMMTMLLPYYACT